MKVLNKYRDVRTASDFYIGRGSPFGNPFVIGIDGNRAEVCVKYEEYLLANPQLIELAKTKLKGKNLVCYCAPLQCHGDLLLKIANE